LELLGHKAIELSSESLGRRRGVLCYAADAWGETIGFTNSTNRGIGPPRAGTWTEVEEIVLSKMEEWATRAQSGRKELSGG
jgi:hypothetical protein